LPTANQKEETVECGKLFRAEDKFAFYDAGHKHVVVGADVWLNPTADRVHICPNPIAPIVGPREFIVEGTTLPGIHPDPIVKRRISFSFPSDQTPKSVVLYSMGVDAPDRQEIPVRSSPPAPLLAPGGPEVPSPPAAATGVAVVAAPVTVVGFSATFSFDGALADAMAKAHAAFPSSHRNPDVAVSVEVKTIFARSGGFIQPGLYLTATAK
jgi:hypothetical protein